MKKGSEESRLHSSDFIESRWPKKKMALRPRLSAKPAPIGMKTKDVVESSAARLAPSF